MTKNLRSMAVFAAVLTGSLTLLPSLSQAKQAANVPAKTTKPVESYYCMVTGPDGAASIQTLTSDEMQSMEKKLLDQRKDEVAKWIELKKKWAAAAGARQFPVPLPRPTKVASLGRVPADEKTRKKMADRFNHDLEVWAVCGVKDAKGAVTAEVIRRDQINARQTALMTDYVNDVIEFAAAKKEKGGALTAEERKGVPALPAIQVKKSDLTSKEVADKLAAQLTQQFEEQEKKRKEEEEKKQQAAEQKKAEAEAKPDAPAPPAQTE